MTKFNEEYDCDEEKLPIEKLLDENDCDNIFLYDEYDKRVEFEQVAIIPREDDGEITVYCILKPAEPMPGVGEDEALVFAVREIDDEDALVLVDDKTTVNAVFADYYELLKTETGGAE